MILATCRKGVSGEQLMTPVVMASATRAVPNELLVGVCTVVMEASSAT